MTIWKRKNHGNSKKISGFQRLKGRGKNRKNIENFSGHEIILHDATVVDTCYYTFVQTHIIYNNKSELQCKLQTLGGNAMSV